MILGLTGRNGAGKGEVAHLSQDRGFAYLSLSDVIREELVRRGRDLTREELIRVGRELRARFGDGHLAQHLRSRIEPDRDFVVDSFRHPSEVQVFRDRSDFFLLNVEARSEIRFERIRERARESDPPSLEEFRQLEQREAASEESHGQQLDACTSLADAIVENNGTLEELHREMSRLLSRLMKQVQRPDWDDYFMRMARVASLRSNCIKRKVGAVIVQDRRIISTGYNGTPRGTRNCFEGGCARCNNLASSGTQLEECLCSHGEENAITQAAYHGVSVKGALLYTTFAPCLMCTKMIINAGIAEVVYSQEYPLNDTSFKLLQEAGVQIRLYRAPSK